MLTNLHSTAPLHIAVLSSDLTTLGRKKITFPFFPSMPPYMLNVRDVAHKIPNFVLATESEAKCHDVNSHFKTQLEIANSTQQFLLFLSFTAVVSSL